MVAQIFEQPAGEISHVEERDVGERVARSHGRLRSVAGRAGDMVEPGGARDVDAAMDRMDPRRAGKGNDDAGRAEDRQPADDAEARVPGFCASASPPGMEISISASATRTVCGRDLLDRLNHHLARHRVDRRLARRDRQARQRHRADAFSGLEPDAVPSLAASHRRDDLGLMRHVGVVSCILDDARPRTAVARRRLCKARRRASRRAAAGSSPDRETRR